MSFESIRSTRQVPTAVPTSETESARFDLDIGRVEFGPDAKVDLDDLIALIERSPLDVIVVRYPASWIDFPARLVVRGRHSHQADTLMYYVRHLADRPPQRALPEGFTVRPVGAPG